MHAVPRHLTQGINPRFFEAYPKTFDLTTIVSKCGSLAAKRLDTNTPTTHPMLVSPHVCLPGFRKRLDLLNIMRIDVLDDALAPDKFDESVTNTPPWIQ